ncbi:helix-turn-helix domain-containing protein [Glaciihabitans sp. GrIS 2.15]|uniref:helix-turn-helix domain-containing protein n=1 Tax=Glaciihabitans sp. GrIS 2.15 TaxID=3071710 RepID=UPI002E045AB8|nr:transcriptional regulator with XRE-family HTH domain [Glaciihabitans sp. GrIS 2.15]
MNESAIPLGKLTNAIATNIRELRKLKGLTQLELGNRVGLNSTAIAKIETKRRNVSAEELWALAAALEVEVGSFYGYPGSQEDRLLTMLVLTPERELDAQLRSLKHFVSGSGDATLSEAARKIEDGVNEYRKQVPNPYELTASPEQVEQALAEAARILANHRQFSNQVAAALNSLNAPAPQGPPTSERSAQRLKAQRVQRRGAPTS